MEKYNFSNLIQTIKTTQSDFHLIRRAMIEKGMSVPIGTPTSEYASIIRNFTKPWDGSQINTFANSTEEEFTAMVNAHYNGDINISDYWHIGDIKTIHLNTIPQMNYELAIYNSKVEFSIAAFDECDIPIRIIGFDHDDLVTPINGHTKAAITCDSVYCLSTQKYASGVPYNPYQFDDSWENSHWNKWCNDYFFVALPTMYQNLIKEVVKPVIKGSATADKETIVYVNEKTFFLSCGEIYHTLNMNYGFPSIDDGDCYEFYQIPENRNLTDYLINTTTRGNRFFREPFWQIPYSSPSLFGVDGTNSIVLVNSSYAGGSPAPAFCF